MVAQAIVELSALKACDMVVLSDANTEFIHTILQHHSLQGCFQQARVITDAVCIIVGVWGCRACDAHHHIIDVSLQVTSNEGIWEDGALRVKPYHRAAQPHGCLRCPANLCKGLVGDHLQTAAMHCVPACLTRMSAPATGHGPDAVRAQLRKGGVSRRWRG